MSSSSAIARAINDMLHMSDADQSSLFEVIEEYFDEQINNSQSNDSNSDTDHYPGKLIKFKKSYKINGK